MESFFSNKIYHFVRVCVLHICQQFNVPLFQLYLWYTPIELLPSFDKNEKYLKQFGKGGFLGRKTNFILFFLWDKRDTTQKLTCLICLGLNQDP